MEVSEEVTAAKEVIQAFLRAKKNLRMYPPNNPIYLKTVEDTFKKVDGFFDFRDELDFRIKQNEILLGTDSVYKSSGKDDNLALFFFKDGLREIVFKKGLDQKELLAFLKVVAFDFESEEIEDDIVTLLWEKDFANIRYVVDEEYLTEDENYEADAIAQVKEDAAEEDDLKKAFEDAVSAEEVKEEKIIPITEKDLAALSREIKKDASGKTKRLVEILFEMLYRSESHDEFRDIIGILTNALEFCVRTADFTSAVAIFHRTKKLVSTSTLSDGLRRQLYQIFVFGSSEKIIKIIGEYLDKTRAENSELYLHYVKYLGKEAIKPFMTILGELQTIEARKAVIGALTFLGTKDVDTLSKGLNDPRWYVVRNIIYVLRTIKDRRVVDYLIRAARHSDVRVRKEVIKALGDVGHQGVINTLKDALGDHEPAVRTTAVRALGIVGTDAAKKIILGRINDAKFINLDFSEKKDYFTVLARWNDNTVVDFLVKTLRRRAFFRRHKNDENRACAAFSLGLMNNKDHLSQLYKLRDSKNKLLSEYAYTAIKRIEYGK